MLGIASHQAKSNEIHEAMKDNKCWQREQHMLLVGIEVSVVIVEKGITAKKIKIKGDLLYDQ